MDNKIFGTTFLAILVSAFVFFGVANAGALAVDKWFFPVEKFGNNTYIGSADVSDMEVMEAKPLVAGAIESWKQTSELLVTYQDATAAYPLESAEILLDETVQGAQTGTQNGFVFSLSDAATQTFLAQNFPTVEFSNEQVQQVSMKLEEGLKGGQARTLATISDDSSQAERAVVSAVNFPHDIQSKRAPELLAALDGYEIAPDSQFSLIRFLDEMDLQEIPDQELTEIASAIYAVVLQSNFEIDERNIGTKVPANIPVGQEAAINRALNADLIFTNPNDSSFVLNIGTAGSSLNASLTGLPFVYSYSVQMDAEEAVKPRLIKQYSAFVNGASVIEEPGTDGVRLNVNRIVTLQGEEVELEPISTDFYPPVHRIEIYPLASTETVTEDGTTVNPDAGTGIPDDTDGTANTNEGTANPDSAGTENGTPSAGSENGNPSTGSGNSGNTNTDTGGNAAGNNGSSSGGSTGNGSSGGNGGSGGASGNGSSGSNGGTGSGAGNASNPTSPVYDKGGNIINP